MDYVQKASKTERTSSASCVQHDFWSVQLTLFQTIIKSSLLTIYVSFGSNGAILIVHNPVIPTHVIDCFIY
jgi:hypothetical protein